MTSCANNDWEEAKSFLFKMYANLFSAILCFCLMLFSIEISPHSLPGLISLAVYACYSDDMTLLRASLDQEVQLSGMEASLYELTVLIAVCSGGFVPAPKQLFSSRGNGCHSQR